MAILSSYILHNTAIEQDTLIISQNNSKILHIGTSYTSNKYQYKKVSRKVSRKVSSFKLHDFYKKIIFFFLKS